MEENSALHNTSNNNYEEKSNLTTHNSNINNNTNNDNAASAAAATNGNRGDKAEQMKKIMEVMKKFPVIMAPMVGHSELAFRMLCRKYGAKICYSPMINSKMFVEKEAYRAKVFQTCLGDRPLIVQFCGHEPHTLLQAAKMVEDKCDAVDLNAGCPQQIAKRGYYGAFLLENVKLMEEIVRVVSSGLSIPFFCKVRILPTGLDPSLDLYKKLENAGANLIAVHGRTRLENKYTTGPANWDAIKTVKQTLKIPVVANGGMANLDDLYKCLEFTGCDGAMTAEALLDTPSLFYPDAPNNPITISLDYLEMCKIYGESDSKDTRSHVFKFLANMLTNHPTYYKAIGSSGTMEALENVVKELGMIHGFIEGHSGEVCNNPECQKPGGYYYRHRIKKEKRMEKLANNEEGCENGECNTGDDVAQKQNESNIEEGQLKRDKDEDESEGKESNESKKAKMENEVN